MLTEEIWTSFMLRGSYLSPGGQKTCGLGEWAIHPDDSRDHLRGVLARLHLLSTDAMANALAFVVVRVQARHGSASSLSA